MVMTYMAPFFLYSITSSQIHFSNDPRPIVSWVATALMIAAVLTFLLRKVFANAELIRRKRLGMEGEIATGQELNQLMLDGCRVFHDVPFEYGNIDHVVVSKSGVFAVETKMHAKSNDSGSEKVIVDFDNNRLQFSDWNWGIPVKQLETNSRWLSRALI